MARMFGLLGNRPDLAGRVLTANALVLRARATPGKPVGWGVGFFQSGEVLLQRRPSDDRTVVDVTEAVAHVRTDALIAHVRQPRVGALRTENTQPFRYRSWLFGQTGTISGYERLGERLLAALPDFLRRNVRGETDAELCFHLFLSFLHDAGHLDTQRVGPTEVAEALRASVALIDRLSAEEGHPANTGDIMVSNGEHLLVVNRGARMAILELAGRRAIEDLLGSDSREGPIPNPERTRYTLVAGELDAVPTGWTSVADRVIVRVTRDTPPHIEPL